ncbi:MAG TPA: transporter [Woeseiaceae bacterium]|jgi:hypothetical protein|nr:transporter [Woeseiaceae bacterium]
MASICASTAGLVLLATAIGASREAQAAPETFNTALPVAKGELIFREQFLYRKKGDDRGAADREIEVLGGISVLGHGATGDLALFAVLPYVDKRLELTDPSGQRIARSTRGIGDARLFGRYTLVQKDMRGSNFRIAPFLGLELPAGDDDDADSRGTLPATLQPGSGSWDPFGGLIVTYQTLDYQTDAQISYEANTEANGFELGDELRFDASLQYRLWPRELGPGVPGFLYGVIETNLLRRAKDETNGVEDPDSGGTTLFLSPGVQYVTRRWVLEGIVQVPVAQDLNGSALEDDFIVRAGFRMNF